MNEVSNKKFLFKICEPSPYLSLKEDEVYLHFYILDSNERDGAVCKWINVKNIVRSFFEKNTSEKAYIHLVWLQKTNFGLLLAESSIEREEYQLYMKDSI